MSKQSMNHADRFQWERNILADHRLTSTQKNVLIRLALYLNIKTGRCDPAVKTLAEGAGVAERTVQAAISQGVALSLLHRSIGGGRGHTNSYNLLLPQASERVHGDAPLPEERVHHETLFEMETMHSSARKGACAGQEPCMAVHPNIGNNEENIEKVIICRGFEEFWSIYPKRVSRGNAEKAFAKIVKSKLATIDELKLGAMRYAAERTGQDPKFTKHPATWLNQKCWMDEPITTFGGQAHAADEVRAYPANGSQAAASSPLAAGMAAALRERPASRLFEPDDTGRDGIKRRATTAGSGSGQ